ncbi:response regulator [Anaerolineales bacterium HSG25]|nr:response regulator [Anaerolineales bacterium HSG25]
MKHGISPKLIENLEQEMINSMLFDRMDEFRSLFIDARIYSWRDKIPEANNALNRVRAVMAQFHNQYSEGTKKNALVLLLQVLSDRIDSTEACHRRLAELADQLDRELETLAIDKETLAIDKEFVPILVPVLKNKKLLVVEDHPDIVNGIADLFEHRGCLVIRAYDGQEGLAQVQKNQPDMIILDIMMPKMNGYQMCRQLRRKTKDIPVLMLTAAGEQHQHKGMDAGIDSYMVKPYITEALVMEVERLLKRTIDA